MSAEPVAQNGPGSPAAAQRLLEAAEVLFARQGYERTTLRQVGARADVDPALVARHFGSKAELYLASLRRGGSEERPPLDLTEPRDLVRLLDRASEEPSTPVLHAVVRPHADAQLQAASMDHLRRRLLPGDGETGAPDDEQARLRAQVVLAAVSGVALARAGGTFDELTRASSAQVSELLAAAVARLLTS